MWLHVVTCAEINVFSLSVMVTCWLHVGQEHYLLIPQLEKLSQAYTLSSEQIIFFACTNFRKSYVSNIGIVFYIFLCALSFTKFPN